MKIYDCVEIDENKLKNKGFFELMHILSAFVDAIEEVYSEKDKHSEAEQ